MATQYAQAVNGAPQVFGTPSGYQPKSFQQILATRTPQPIKRVSGGGTAAQQPQANQAFSGVPQQEAPAQPSIDFDALIAPALAGLEQAIGPLNQGYQDNVASINSSRTNQLAATNSSIKGQVDTLGQAKTSQEQQAGNAADEARRQYSEIQQGLQSRYGGTTGTGAFATELAGRQTLQNMGQTRQQLSNAVLAIDQKKQQVEEVGRIAVQDIEDKTRDNLNQAKNQLDTAIADIRRQQGELQSRKAELAANAIQIYQNTVQQVNAQNAAFKQNIYLAQMQASQKLDGALQQSQSATSSFSQNLPGINAVQQRTPVQNPGFNFDPRFDAGQPAGGGSLGGGVQAQGGEDFYSSYLKNLGLQ